MDHWSFSSDTLQGNTSERERNENLTDLSYQDVDRNGYNKSLGFRFVLILTNYSVECLTEKSLKC